MSTGALEPDQLERALRRLLWQLRPYLGDLVLIGGWVPYLYRRYGDFANWNAPLSRTGELDVVAPAILPSDGRAPIASLLTEAGLHPVPNAGNSIWASEPASGEKVEFFVAHRGMARDIGRPVALTGQDGLGAIPLTDMSLLQTYTQTVDVPIAVAGAAPQRLPVRVPTLGAYLATKAATFDKRMGGTGDPKRAKDLLYIRDVMAAGAEVVDRVELDVRHMRGTDPSVAGYLDSAANRLAALHLREPTSALRDAAMILAGRDGHSLERAMDELRGYTMDLREILTDEGNA